MPAENFDPESNHDNPIGRILELRRVVLENPKSSEAHCDLGVAMIQSGDPKTAIGYLKQAIEIDQNHERSYYNLGLCYHKIGFTDNAIAAYESVIRLNPKDNQAWANLASLFFQRNEVREAIECYQRSVAINSESPETWLGLSSAQYLAGEYQNAVESVEKSLELDDSSYHSWLQLGQAYYALREAQKSIQAFIKATEAENDCDKSWNSLGNAYLLDHSLEKAEQAYRRAIDLNGSNCDYWFNLGELLFQKEAFSEAARCFSKVIDANPNDTEALEYLAKSLIDTSPLEAANRLNSLIQLKGEQTDYFNLLARAYEKAGKPELEAKTRLKLASSKPMDAENNYSLAKLLIKQGNRDLAYSFFQNGRPLADSDPELWFTFSQSFKLDNKIEDEFQCLTRAIKADPSHRKSWLRLGIIALQNDADANALQYLEKADPLLHNHVDLWLDTCERYLEQENVNQAFQCAFKLTNLVEFTPILWKSIFRKFRAAGMLDEWIESLIGFLKSKTVKTAVKTRFGELIFCQGHQKQALTFLEEIHTQHSEDTDVICCLADLYLKSDQTKMAANLISTALESQSRNYSLLVQQAEIKRVTDQIEPAEKAAREALAIRQDHYKAWLVLGTILLGRSLPDQALEALDKSLSLYSSCAESWYAKGQVLEALKQKYEAEAAFRNCLKLDRRNSRSWLAVAELKMSDRNFSDARLPLLRSVVSDRANGPAWERLADLYDQLEMPEKAKQCREQANAPT